MELKNITLDEVINYTEGCQMKADKRMTPDKVVPLKVTAKDLTEKELNEVSFGEPLKWSVLVSDRLKESGDDKEANVLKALLCKMHNHDKLDANDFLVLDNILSKK